MGHPEILAISQSFRDPLQPIEPQTRIEALDVIRGLGVLGILIVNIQSFALIASARALPVSPADSRMIDRSIWFLTHVLADGKFMTVFSLLFGAGICLMSDRIEGRGLQSRPYHFRRMAFLVALGLCHAYLLWDGDILFTYGLCGSVCWFFRRSRPLRLFVYAVGFLVFGELLSSNAWSSSWTNYVAMLYQCSRDALHVVVNASPAQEVSIYRGSWIQQMVLRVPGSVDAEVVGFWTISFWRMTGTFLLGMGLFRIGFLSGSFR